MVTEAGAPMIRPSKATGHCWEITGKAEPTNLCHFLLKTRHRGWQTTVNYKKHRHRIEHHQPSLSNTRHGTTPGFGQSQGDYHSVNFVFKRIIFIILVMHTGVCVCVSTRPHVCAHSTEGNHRGPGAGVMNSCEPPDSGAGNQTWVTWRAASAPTC